jgi:AraC family transcriptional regulator
MAQAEVPEFWSFQSRRLSVDIGSQSWSAPVARILAPNGFGEECWLDAIPDSVVAVRLGGSHVTKLRGIGAGRTSSVGNFTLQPKGTDNPYHTPGRCSFAQILLSDELLDRACEFAGQPQLSGRLRPDLVFDTSPELNGVTMSYVERALDVKSPPSNLEMEGRALILLDQIVSLHGQVRPTRPTVGGLAPYQLRRVTDYIGDRLTDELSLQELSGLVGLSAHHFCRVFKQSTGLPPHRWQIRQRVEKAKALMLDTDLSLAEIANAAGFADQSHFTTVFRKATGVPPHAWRRNTRS